MRYWSRFLVVLIPSLSDIHRNHNHSSVTVAFLFYNQYTKQNDSVTITVTVMVTVTVTFHSQRIKHLPLSPSLLTRPPPKKHGSNVCYYDCRAVYSVRIHSAWCTNAYLVLIKCFIRHSLTKPSIKQGRQRLHRKNAQQASRPTHREPRSRSVRCCNFASQRSRRFCSSACAQGDHVRFLPANANRGYDGVEFRARAGSMFRASSARVPALRV
jgi:hypothetical protein